MSFNVARWSRGVSRVPRALPGGCSVAVRQEIDVSNFICELLPDSLMLPKTSKRTIVPPSAIKTRAHLLEISVPIQLQGERG